MKKKIASLLMVFIAMFAFVGCSPDAKSYLEDSKKVNQWDKASVSGTMNLSFSGGADNVNLPINIKMDATGLKGQPMLHYIITFGDVSATGFTAPDFRSLKGKSLEYYLDSKNGKLFMEKALLLDMVKSSGERIPDKLKNLKEEFIAINLNDAPYGVTGSSFDKMLIQNQAKSDEMMKLLEKVFSDFNHKVTNVTKNGNSYHYEATGADLVDGGVAGLKHLIKKWPALKTEIMPLLKELEISVTTNDIVNLQKEMKNIEKDLPELKKSVQGSKVSFDTTFNEGNYISKGSMNLNFEDAYKVKLDFDLTTTKNDNLTVTLPNSVRHFNTEEFLDLIAPKIAVGDEVLVEVEEDYLKDMGFSTKNGHTLVPYRAFAEKIGATVAYDAKTKQVKVTKDGKTIVLTSGKKVAMVNGKKVMLDAETVIKNGKTYVPLRFIGENYGYKVSWNQEDRVASLTKKVA